MKHSVEVQSAKWRVPYKEHQGSFWDLLGDLAIGLVLLAAYWLALFLFYWAIFSLILGGI